MKKTVRIIALLILTIFSIISLCSCQSLDNVKNNYGAYTDEDHLAIEFRGSVYRLFFSGDLCFVRSGESGYYVTENGVPALLADFYGSRLKVSCDESLVQTVEEHELATDRMIEEAYASGDYDSMYDIREYHTWDYVREDLYDKFEEIVRSGEMDHYVVRYELDRDVYTDIAYVDSDGELRDTDGDVYIFLDDTVTALIERALSADPGEKVGINDVTDNIDELDTLFVYPCDKDMIFYRYGGSCRLIHSGDRYYFWDGKIAQKAIVPLQGDDANAVKALFEKHPEAQDYNLSPGYENLKHAQDAATEDD